MYDILAECLKYSHQCQSSGIKWHWALWCYAHYITQLWHHQCVPWLYTLFLKALSHRNRCHTGTDSMSGDEITTSFHCPLDVQWIKSLKESTRDQRVKQCKETTATRFGLCNNLSLPQTSILPDLWQVLSPLPFTSHNSTPIRSPQLGSIPCAI